MTSLDRPHGTTIAALKGIAITASLLTAGQLGAWPANMPGLYALSEKQKGPRLAAKQFAHTHKVTQATAPLSEIVSTVVFGGVAYLGYNDSRMGGSAWKLWAGAAGAIFATIPWTVALMSTPTSKLLWVSEVADSATTLPSSGIGVKVDSASPNSSGSRTPNKQGGMLGAPAQNRKGAITPIEEFEPFEDAMIAPEEYEQLKVGKLLQKFNALNAVRAVAAGAAGVMGLWAVFVEA